MAKELQSLSELFEHRLFRIPDYQRGYAWQQTQLEDFWEDLVNLQGDRYHYTGLLSLKNLNKKDVQWGEDEWVFGKGFVPCHIVDGQQRLTTFVILINEMVEFLRGIEENKGISDAEIVLGFDTLEEIVAKYICISKPPKKLITTYIFGYEVDNPSSDYLQYRIFNKPFSGTVNETYYTKNLKLAKRFFRDNLESLYTEDGFEGIEMLYQKLTQRLMFNLHEIDDDYDVFVAFETMNNRGKKLTNLELLKNRLIYLSTLYPDEKLDEYDKNALRRQINEAWKEVYYQLGRNEKTPLSDDEFLRAHWIAYFSYSRKRGNDYIDFLLNKFSAKNIFEKKTVISNNGDSEELLTDELELEVENVVDSDDTEMEILLKLEPVEISDYVNSLKDAAKYWYYTYFPCESEHLSDEEKVWVDRINRVGIGYFRPMIMAILSRTDFDAKQRVEAFKAIERFIFIGFRLGNFNASFRSSEYYRYTRNLYHKEIEIETIIDDIVKTTDENIQYAIPNFITRIHKHFDNGGGYYYWNSIKYFLYQYEYRLAKKNNLDKLSWEMFTKREKDKVSIEHILPQTPTKYYWRNQFRQFTTDEITRLSCALGNLLPLSQSKNSSLQNDSFDDKKNVSGEGKVGYKNGSHSEIEVAQNEEWTAEQIYNRSKQLLEFMADEWGIEFDSEEMEELIYLDFVNDGREIPPVLVEDELSDSDDEIPDEKVEAGSNLEQMRLSFWTGYVAYCKKLGREKELADFEPTGDNYHDFHDKGKDFLLSLTITRKKYLTVLIYAFNGEAFARLEGKKDLIEENFGQELDWYSSKKTSVAKRILCRRETEIYNPEKQEECFAWLVEKYDKLRGALVAVGEL